MKLALISLSKDDPEGSGPIGLLPLFDENVVDRQVRMAIRMGAEKIIFLCPTMPGAILQYIDRLKQEMVDAEIVRSARELVQYSSNDNQLLVLSDGILLSPQLEKTLTDQSDELLYVVANAEIFEDFERIDLNQRWVGLAYLQASRLSMMIDIPDDWNVGSALLRIAVQSECQRQIISDPEMVAGAVIHLENGSEAEEYTKRKLAEPGLAKGGICERYLLWPLARRILPRLWQTPNAPLYLRTGALVTSICAASAAYLQQPILALAFLLVAGLAGTIRRQMDVFSNTSFRYFSEIPIHPNVLDATTDIIKKAALLILIAYASTATTIVPNLLVLTLIWGQEFIVQMLPDPPSLRLFKLGSLLPIVIVSVAAAFGHFLVGVYTLAVWSIIYTGLIGLFVARDFQSLTESTE